MKSNWITFVPLLKVIKCEFLFFNQVFFIMKSHIANSRIATLICSLLHLLLLHEFFQKTPPFFPTWLVRSPPIKRFSLIFFNQFIHAFLIFLLNGLFQPYLRNVHTTILIFSSPKTSFINMIISPILQISTFSLRFLSMIILSHLYFYFPSISIFSY